MPTQYICSMQVNRILIESFLSLSRAALVLDVRSPAEYHHAHIPGAISLPLFSDEERKQVGTAYKQESREKAIKIGLDFFGPRMRKMVEEVEGLLEKRKKDGDSTGSEHPAVFVYCWRGGMRSGAVSWLLNLYGFRVYTLAGGYKAFRNLVLKTFEHPYSFKILGGFTGSGKTAVLEEMARRGERVIDLERIAGHRGSAFGNLDLPPQPSQEMFENRLALEMLPLQESSLPIWLEDESQRIGNLNLPGALWQNMRRSPLYFFEIPFEERLDYIVQEYGQGDPQKLVEATQRISKRLGGLETRNTLAFLQEGHIREGFRILLHYYDKLYLKALHNREDVSSLLNKIACEKVTPLNARAIQYQTL
ncbi:MAG: tRNA 2-selenouridine(34) synthase MnmH [Flavisolibacter sp.]